MLDLAADQTPQREFPEFELVVAEKIPIFQKMLRSMTRPSLMFGHVNCWRDDGRLS